MGGRGSTFATSKAQTAAGAVGVSGWSDCMGYPDIRAFRAIDPSEIEAGQRRRCMWQIETLIADSNRRADDLEREIRTG